MFRMFHVSKTKADQPEEWSTGKAKELYLEMEDQRLLEEMIRDDGEEPLDDWGIYKEIVAKPKHGKIRGLGDAMEPPNELCASSSSKSCTNGSCLEREKEIGELKQEVGTLKDGLADMKQLVQALIANVAPSLKMSIDKSWMQLKLSDPKYFNGVASFMEFAISHALDSDGKVRCPCRDDKNTYRFILTTVQRHLLYRGFMEDYIVWDKHGEKEDSDSSVTSDSENYNDSDISAGFDQCDDV
ncbi:uncharacterized protein LOC126787107 [Argentina anserina]|uniref:uncharacterized protein LOC126787107 n=1 Tax=Argentina anserina TaxID=57926 RepID=UPI002176287A|nr:uncharacterized protein LOC126787107 [Potentilla anserina]